MKLETYFSAKLIPELRRPGASGLIHQRMGYCVIGPETLLQARTGGRINDYR
jgi:hypothetical protein